MLKVYYAYTQPLLEDSVLFWRIYARMPLNRRDKVDRMVRSEDKCLSLGAGALLEYALLEQGLIRGPEDYAIDYGPAGQGEKPRLLLRRGGQQMLTGIDFNLSHSHGAVMCALADHAVGCDVEQEADRKTVRLADRFFGAEELEQLHACRTREEERTLFFRYWTLKESFMKVTGLGFKLPLDAFSILLYEKDALFTGSEDTADKCVEAIGTPIQVKQDVDDRTYYFREYAPGDGCRYALCSVDPALADDGTARRMKLVQLQ